MSRDLAGRLPTISVVTPSFNQAEYLPRCIASVAEQTHPAIEHLVYDPGSTDSSREIAEAAPTVRLIAEPDNGQADAVGRGCREATGEIIAWINSDDFYADTGVFELVAKRFAQTDAPDVVYGGGRYEDPDGTVLGQAYIFDDPSEISSRLAGGVGVLQPAVFVRRAVMNDVGGPNTDLHYAMDYDLWVRLAQTGYSFAFLDASLAVALIHDQAKTEDGTDGSLLEAIGCAQEHYGHVSWAFAVAQAESELFGRNGVVKGALTPQQEAEARRHGQRIFDGYNRNLRAISRLLSPPWDKPSLNALSHLVRRVGS